MRTHHLPYGPFFINHPLLFLNFFAYSCLFLFFSEFLAFSKLWVTPLGSVQNSTSETPLILFFSFGWVCYFPGFSPSWAILNLVFWAYFFITPIFKPGSSTIGFGAGFYIWCTKNFVWFVQSNMFFPLFLPVFSNFWKFFWVRFFL